MTLFARLFRLVWGGDVDRALRPVLAVSLVGSIAGAAAYPVPRHLGDQGARCAAVAARVRLSRRRGARRRHRLRRRPLSDRSGGAR